MRARRVAFAALLATLGACDGDETEQMVTACRAVAPTVVASGEGIAGPEDIAVDHAAGVAYVSAYDRRTEAKGGIYRLDLEGDLRDDVAVADVTADWPAERPFHPHGISLFVGADGRKSLFVINHRIGGAGRSTVEVFDIVDDALVHRGEEGTISHPLICFPNDLAAVGESSFFVTNDHGCGGPGRIVEDVLGLERAGVVYYDDGSAREVARGLAFANGIAIGPPGDDDQPARLFVAATREKAVNVYDVDALLGGLEATEAPMAAIGLDGGPDNLSWLPDGRLLVAAHPSLFRLWLHLLWGGPEKTPSRLVAVDPAAPEQEPALVYADDGSEFSAATAGAAHRGRLLIGAVTGDRLVVCRYPEDRAGA